MRDAVELDKVGDVKNRKSRDHFQVTCAPFRRMTIIANGAVMRLGPKESKQTGDWEDCLGSRTNSLPDNSTVTLSTSPQLCYFSKGSQQDR